MVIVCWKWRPEKESKHYAKRVGFSSRHVNVLFASIERNFSRMSDFVCVTDNAKGLNSNIRSIDINEHFGSFKSLGGCYRRFKAFDRSTGISLFGERFISIDIDVVVLKNLDSVFDLEDDFKVWEDTFRRRTPYCGSLWGMAAGSRQRVWSDFDRDPRGCIDAAVSKRYIGTDQAHVSACLYPGEATWGAEDGIYNFNTQIRRPGVVPGDARLVFFNGKYDPSQRELQQKYDWIGDAWHE